MPEIIIIGAGITGLSAASFLKGRCLVLEKERTPGGLCGSVSIEGFTFDYSGHFLHLRTSFAQSFFKRRLGKNLRSIKRDAVIHAFERTIPFPFQANLYALPRDIREECVNSFRERPEPVSPSGTPFLLWSTSTFGAGITRHFMQPYNEKLWTVSGRKLTADWVGPFVPRPTEAEILESAARPQTGSFGYNARFFYPAHGGSAACINAIGCPAEALRCGTASEHIDIRNRRVHASSGESFPYEHLISTQPLPELLSSISSLPAAVRRAAGALDWNSVICVNLGFSEDSIGETARKHHWLYFPEKKYPFYRAGIYTNVAPAMAPPGHASFYVEISHRPDAAPNIPDLLTETISGLKDAKMLARRAAPAMINIMRMPYAYVIYDRRRTAALNTIMPFLERHGIHSIGRYGAWEYSFMERSVLQAKETVRKILKRT